MPKWDIHTHTKLGSDCSKMSPETLIVAAARVGLDGICIVDHAPPFGPEAPSHAYDEVREYGRDLGVEVIIGTEVSHIHRGEEEHFLVLLPNEERLLDVDNSRYLNNEWQLRCARDEGGLVIHAHPNHIEEYSLLEFVDAVEIANGLAWRGYAAGPDPSVFYLPTTGGSDAHAPDIVGLCYTHLEQEVYSVEGLITEIRASRCRAVIDEEALQELGDADQKGNEWERWWAKVGKRE